MTLCSLRFRPAPALLARETKLHTGKKLSIYITLRRESLVWPTSYVGNRRSRQAATSSLGSRVNIDRREEKVFFYRSVRISMGLRIYFLLYYTRNRHLVAPPRHRFSLLFRAPPMPWLRLIVWWMSGKIYYIKVPLLFFFKAFIFHLPSSRIFLV